MCATSGFQKRRDNQRRRSHAEKTRRSAIKLSTLQVCINKMPDGRHQSTHMVPAIIRWTQLARVTPQKLRWHALTWKPTANGEHPTPTKQGMCHNSSDAAQKTRTQQQIWSTNPHIKKYFLPLGKHDFVTNELRTLPMTHRTRNMRHMRQKKKRQHFAEDEHSSRHTCAQQTKM